MLNEGQIVDVIKKDIVTLMEKIEKLEGVIYHCWLHSGYSDCGSSKMTESELCLYQDAIRCESRRIDGLR